MLFTIGVIGALTRRNAIVVFMSIELMLNAVNLTFVTFSRFLQSMDGVLFAFFVIAVAAAEAAVGLAIFVMIYRSRETINVDEINLLKW
jgi:NADH-quinone oxidoreductase subunit K